MRAAARFDDGDSWSSPALSVALHLAAGAALIFVPLTQQRLLQPNEPLPVEIVTMRQFESETKPAEPIDPQPPLGAPLDPSTTPRTQEAAIPRPTPQAPAIASETPTMVRPRRMFSEIALADPRSRKAREQLRILAADERIVQLCNIEAMEQVHAWKAAFRPEAVVAYAMQQLRMQGGSIVADGAAFYSERNWYRLRFECDVQVDKVVSFAFSVGETIPRSQWEAHHLGERVADDDN
jgi:hypothetical protein